MKHLVIYFNAKKNRLLGLIKASGNLAIENEVMSIIDRVAAFDFTALKKSYAENVLILVNEIYKMDFDRKLSAILIEHDSWDYQGQVYGFSGGNYPLMEGTKKYYLENFGTQEAYFEGVFDYSTLWGIIDENTLLALESKYLPNSGLLYVVKDFLAAKSYLILSEAISKLQLESPEDHILNRIPFIVNEFNMPEVTVSIRSCNKYFNF